MGVPVQSVIMTSSAPKPITAPNGLKLKLEVISDAGGSS
jgi:hypothetical protein